MDEPTIEGCIVVADGEAAITPAEAARLEAELATLRRKAAAFDRYDELASTHVERGHRPRLPGCVLSARHGVAGLRWRWEVKREDC